MTQDSFPIEGEPISPDADPELVDFEDADTIFEALASETARTIVGCLAEEPTTPSILAERVDTSVQNVTYHLRRLTDAGLVETVGTRYSDRGVEMDVYAPASDPVVICVGDDQSDRTVTGLLGGTGDTAASRVSSD